MAMAPQGGMPGPEYPTGGRDSLAQPRLPIRYLPRPQTLRITFEKGVDESQEASVLPPGFLTSSKNWVPEPTGGLRARRSFVIGTDAAGTGGLKFRDQSNVLVTCTYPATKFTRTVDYVSLSDGIGDNPGGKWWLVTCRNDQDGGAIQLWGMRADFDQASLLTEPWYVIYQFGAAVNDNIPIAMAKGTGNTLFTHPAITDIKRWTGAVDQTTQNIFNIGDTNGFEGRAIAYHKQRFYMGGAFTQGFQLHYSDLNSTTSWPASNFLNIGKDDNFPIEDIAEFGTNLIVGKKSGVWIVSGSDPDTFNVNRIDGASVCAGRSLIPTPYGLVILGEYEAWLYTGAAPQLISPAVENSYAAGAPNSWRMGSYDNGTVYIYQHRAPGTSLAFDLVHGLWHTESMGVGNNHAADTFQTRQAVGLSNVTNLPFVAFREYPNSPRGNDWAQQSYHAETPELFLLMEEPITIRHVYLRYRQRSGTTGDNSLNVTVTCGGQVLNPQPVGPQAAPGRYVQRLDFGQTLYGLQINFDSTGNATYDPEGVDIVYDITGPR